MIRGAYEPKSNRESFIDDIELWQNGIQLDLTGVTAKVQLEYAGEWGVPRDYLPYFNYGSYCPAKLLATTENGSASIVSGLSIHFVFTAAQMATLPSGQYRLSAIATSADGSSTIQLFQLQVSILDGGVPT